MAIKGSLGKPLQQIIDKNLEQVVDYSPESGQCLLALEDIAKRENCALMAFIAPYAAIRVSPVEMRSASIGLSEEFGIIGTIDKIKSDIARRKKIDNLYLLINTPGGLVHSSYKVAKVLRKSFKNIKVFVPHLAASGGTLMSMCGNGVVMGRMSHLSPIDVQVSYNGQYVSAYCMSRALSRLSEYYSTITPDEAPYPWKCMTEKIDPILMEDWSSNLLEIADYTQELMILSGYDEKTIRNVVNALVYPMRSHAFVIDLDKAKKLKIKLSNSDQDMEYLKIMEAWLTEYMLKAADKHIIKYVLPKNTAKRGISSESYKKTIKKTKQKKRTRNRKKSKA